jgi:hypothetical protein
VLGRLPRRPGIVGDLSHVVTLGEAKQEAGPAQAMDRWPPGILQANSPESIH